MSQAPYLTPDLLRQLEGEWGKQDAPISECLAPGASDQELAAAVEGLEVRLPDEARIWWAWHNGVVPESSPQTYQLGPGLEFFSLDAARANYDRDQTVAEELVASGDAENTAFFWPGHHFAITFNGGPIVVDCNTQPGQPTPLYWLPTHDVREDWLDRPLARSLGEVVTWWTQALQTGAWSWDPDQETWRRDATKIPEERRYLV